jgi:uracil-DNA glycosylase
VVFLLWGSAAQKKGYQVDPQKHLVLKSPHPSPFSAQRGFFGCRHFSKCNEYLVRTGRNPVDWALPRLPR